MLKGEIAMRKNCYPLRLNSVAHHPKTFGQCLSEAGKQVQANKIRTILRIALYHGHDALVLGAFGCGDYGLNPDEVARIFFEVFQEEEFSDRFKKVIFAIKERKSRGKIIGEEGLYKPFYDLFKNR